ncbi:MAG TPA: winged helix-turn-helix domain-containing protein [Caulobacteraceae bacterium]|nr:winged helix-turn-helix domain-containing protein [Caulobacteraceae bacterium]
MNEMFSLRRPVDLASEGPFLLGGLKIVPAALEVHAPDGVQALEPRVMQVLVALHRARGGPVSRDELSDLCWEGRIVGEDALNRCVGRLRKVLAVEPRAAIDTIPKIGYRLRVDPTRAVAASPHQEGRLSRPSRLQGRAWIAASAAVIAMAAIGASVWAARAPATWSAEGVRPLTAEPGVETHPALSPDGRFLIYAAGEGFGAPRDLYLRATGEGAPLRLTRTAADESAPVWSPDGARYAFVRQDGGPCTILIATAPSGQERVAGRCRTDSQTRLAWTASGELLFADRPAPDAVRRLRALNPETGQARDVTRPAVETFGDADPVSSPDGRTAVFRRSLSHGIDDLYLVDVDGGRERALTRDGWKSIGYAWSPDGRSLFYATNRGGDFGLWSVNVGGGGEPRRVSLGLLAFGRMSADREGRLAVETSASSMHLVRLDRTGALTELTASSGNDWHPDVAPDGALVFVSDQSGSPEIWVRPAAGAPAKLTDLKAGYVSAPRWSPDGRQAAFIAAREHRSDIYLINADGSALRRLTTDGGAKAEAVWSADGRSLVFAARSERGWGLMRAGLDGRAAPVAGAEGFRAVRVGPDGALYALKPGDNRLWTIPENGAPRLVAPGVRVADDAGWAIGREGVYEVRGRSGAPSSVWLNPWSGTARKVADLPAHISRRYLTLDTRDGALLFSRMQQDDADVLLLDLKS